MNQNTKPTKKREKGFGEDDNLHEGFLFPKKIYNRITGFRVLVACFIKWLFGHVQIEHSGIGALCGSVLFISMRRPSLMH